MTSRQGRNQMSLEKVQIPSQRPIYPTPAGLVTTVDGDGNPNIITLGEIYNLSIRQPVIVGLGIAPERYSHRLLCECREFVVNLPDLGAAGQGAGVRQGLGPGRAGQVRHGRLDPAASPKGQASPDRRMSRQPRMQAAGKSEPIGDHDLFKGEVLVEHVDADLIDEKGELRTERLDVLVFARWTFWTVGKQVGVRGEPETSAPAVGTAGSDRTESFHGKFGTLARKPKKCRVFQGFRGLSPILTAKARNAGKNFKKTTAAGVETPGDYGCSSKSLSNTRRAPQPPARFPLQGQQRSPPHPQGRPCVPFLPVSRRVRRLGRRRNTAPPP